MLYYTYSRMGIIYLSNSNTTMIIISNSRKSGKGHYILPVCNMTCLNLFLVFAVSFTPEMPNFGTFGGVAQPLKNIIYFF